MTTNTEVSHSFSNDIISEGPNLDVSTIDDEMVPTIGTNTGLGTNNGVVGDRSRPRTIYIGHSGTTLHNRMSEHCRAVMGQRGMKSGIAKHHAALHVGHDPTYWSSRILDVQSKNLNRLASEALNILRNGTTCSLINSKGEFGKMNLPRLILRDHPTDVRDQGMDLDHNGPPWHGPYHQWDPE